MATIGWLKIGSAVDLGPFQKGMAASAGLVSELKGKLLGLAAAAGVGLSVNALKNYVSSTIDAIAETNALATRVGFSVESFQKLAYIARKSAVDQDTLATSLGQMSKRIGEVAIEGTGPAADSLKRFGVQARDLAKLSGAEQFGVIVKIFEKISDPVERSKTAMDLFGRSGLAMVQIMAKGGPEMERLGQEAERLGFAMSAIDNEKALQAKSAMVDLTLAAEGFANMLVVQVAPYLTLVLEKYKEWAYGGTKSADFLSRGLSIVQSGLGYVLDAVSVLSSGFYGLRSVVDFVIGNMAGGFELVLKGIKTVVEAMASLAGNVSPTAEAALKSVSAKIDQFAGGVKAFKEGMQEAASVDFQKAKDSFAAIGKGGEKVKSIMDEIDNKATERAKESAKKKEKFLTPGELNYQRPAIGFASAEAQAGTAASHSAILQSKGLQINAQANMAMDVKNTAENTGNLVGVANAIHRTLVDQGAKANIPSVPGKI